MTKKRNNHGIECENKMPGVTVADSLLYRNYVQLIVHVVLLPLLSLAIPVVN